MTHTPERLDGDDVVSQHWPYDGPHSADSVREAAIALPALVRYLNNATGPGNGHRTLEHAATVDQVVGHVGSAVAGLDQLLGQLAGVLDRQAGENTVYDDRRDRPGEQTAHAAAESIQDARAAAQSLADWLRLVRDTTNHIGNND